MVSILRRYLYNKSPISNKYFNHGKCVPIQKYSNNVQKRSFSTSNISPVNNNINYVKLYENALVKKEIINENKNKSGICLLTNLITNDKYVGQSKSPLYGTSCKDETKALMRLAKKGENNPFYGKNHKDETKALIKEKAIGRKHLPSILELMSKVRGNPVNIYEKCSDKGFKFIGGFISARKAGLFLGISGSLVIKYMHSGEISKERYKFSSKLPK